MTSSMINIDRDQGSSTINIDKDQGSSKPHKMSISTLLNEPVFGYFSLLNVTMIQLQ